MFAATSARVIALRVAGYRVIEKWECQNEKTREPLPQKEKRTYPHAIFYDFESYHAKTKRTEAKRDLFYKNAHVPISMSLGDTLDREPKHICDPNPKELIHRFMEELERRRRRIRAAVWRRLCPKVWKCCSKSAERRSKNGATRS